MYSKRQQAVGEAITVCTRLSITGRGTQHMRSEADENTKPQYVMFPRVVFSQSLPPLCVLFLPRHPDSDACVLLTPKDYQITLVITSDSS